MGHNEIGVMILKVSRGNRHHQPRETANGKERDGCNRVQHRRLKSHTAPPHRGQPVKDFYTGWNSDQHRGVHKEQLTGQRHTHGVHVMRPNNKR